MKPSSQARAEVEAEKWRAIFTPGVSLPSSAGLASPRAGLGHRRGQDTHGAPEAGVVREVIPSQVGPRWPWPSLWVAVTLPPCTWFLISGNQ